MIYRFKGKEIPVDDSLVEEFNNKTYMRLTDVVVAGYLGLHFDTVDTIEDVAAAIAPCSNEELGEMLKEEMIFQIDIMS